MACHRTILLLACAPLFGQQYAISTIAGGGVAGAILSNPTSLAVDSAGDIYVSDWSGYIRKIWVKEGATTVVAGTGTLGFRGDGGQATLATFGKAIHIGLDSTGNISIADGDNNRIRRIDVATGIMTTVASVPQPTGVVADDAGNLYFSSSWSRVQKLVANTGTIETLAGQLLTGFGGDGGPAINALFWDPVPAVVSRAGDIYIADYENSRIRMVAAKTGIVTTIAGSGPCPLNGVQPFNAMVCQGAFAGDGGRAVSAKLNYPASLALDGDGNLYIADTINHRIRRVDASTGLIYTIAGNGYSGFSGDGGPAMTAEMTFPAGIAVDRSGRVYFADESNNRIRMLTPIGLPRYRFSGPPGR